MATETLRPNGVGAESNLTPFVGPANYQDVDEVVSDEDATYVSLAPSSNLRDLYQIADSGVGAGLISNVRVYGRAKETTGEATLYLALSSGGVGESGVKALTASYADYFHDWAAPPGGGGWDWTKIDALQAGVRLVTPAKTGAHCTQVWVVVTYTVMWVGKISGVTNPGKIMGVATTAIGEVKGVPGV